MEIQITKKCIGIKCPNNTKMLQNESHYALDILAIKYYDGNKEKLVRETSALLKDEVWVIDIIERVTS
ncbi:MAG: hypothetical protein LAKADJCE_00869 [Candidatus Argoarchaeum ethanivorans]|uniref:Uncharacterized protein n=1 Tax=Candidatus Argoarchaeum ethanivorans TaxID=2608793 RepID=A0A811TFI1_9EURY|nr:MAG: hypothetical protein LAKADJCE_00869 [Candidatus Argoarchaeum ethanivorans]